MDKLELERAKLNKLFEIHGFDNLQNEEIQRQSSIVDKLITPYYLKQLDQIRKAKKI